jgi:hypothetical protein
VGSEAGGGGRWDPPWRHQWDAPGGAYSDPPTVLSAVIFFATTDQYADALAHASSSPVRSQARIDRIVSEAEVRQIFQTALGVCLWIWMAVKNGEGRRWARVVATVFGVINVTGFVLGGALAAGLDSQDLYDYLLPQLVVGTASVVLGIVVLVLLYREPSSRYYDDTTRYEAAMTLRGYR